jgi:hypothetical protein
MAMHHGAYFAVNGRKILKRSRKEPILVMNALRIGDRPAHLFLGEGVFAIRRGSI